MNKKYIILSFLIFLLSFSLLACQNKDQVITEEFNNTSWKDDIVGTTLLFGEGNLMVNSGEIKPNMDSKDIEEIRYETNDYENIKIVLSGKSIKISNNDDLSMEFVKLSDDKMKDPYGSIFIKKDYSK